MGHQQHLPRLFAQQANKDRRVLGTSSGSHLIEKKQWCLDTERRTQGQFQGDPELLEKPVGQVMTARPVVISSDRLAAEVLRVFQTHRIDDLVVVDGEHRPAGLVDTQDLARFRLL